MANAKEHAIIGAVAGVGAYCVVCWFFDKKADMGELIACGGVGMLAGLAPDILEPALNPNHRSFFHSGLAAILATQSYLRLTADHELLDGQRKALSACLFGYLSHLCLDAATPAGIPLLW